MINAEGMSRSQLLYTLGVERRRVQTRIALLRREIAERANEIEELEARLRAIDESEGYLS